MPSPTTPMHGKHGALYRLRPNGFIGNGLNDVTWGAFSSASNSAYFEAEIDAEGTPDTFKWRENGGTWNTGVAITGASQNLVGVNGTQAIAFGAMTGHTLGDKWVIGNLYAEPTIESGAEAQITDTAMRLLNPNAPPIFSDSGGETVLKIDHVRGKAVFTGNVATVTVAGVNGYIPEAALEKVGYLVGWNLDTSVDMADASHTGQDWKEGLPGLAGGSGGADAFFIGSASFLDALKSGADGSQKYILLQLFNYDPDQDQTGDHFICWAVVSGISPNSPIGELVKEPVTFQLHGTVAFAEGT